METTIMGYVGITIRIHSFLPSEPKVGRKEPEEVQKLIPGSKL